MPKYIVVPETVSLKDPMTDQVILDREGKPAQITFKEFMLNMLNDPSWLKTLENVRAGTEIMDLLRKGKSVIVLDKDVWEKLKTVVEAPSYTVNTGMGQEVRTGFSYTPMAMMQILHYVDAVIKAGDKEPEEV